MRPDKYKTPDWLLTLDCLAFIVMGSVSIIQNTIFLRNMALTVGAGIGAYLVYRNRHNLMSPKAYPVALIAMLFLWVLLHYLFFSTDVASQYRELTGIWKRILLAFLFALGLGLSVPKASRFNLYRISSFPFRFLKCVTATSSTFLCSIIQGRNYRYIFQNIT